MASAREIYEQSLSQQKINEEVNRRAAQKATQEAERARITAAKRKNEAAQQALQNSGAEYQLKGLGEAVKGRVVNSETGLTLIFNENKPLKRGYDGHYNSVSVRAIVDESGKSTGFDVNGIEVTSQEDLNKALAEATLHPKRVTIPGIEDSTSSSCQTSGCEGGC